MSTASTSVPCTQAVCDSLWKLAEPRISNKKIKEEFVEKIKMHLALNDADCFHELTSAVIQKANEFPVKYPMNKNKHGEMSHTMARIRLQNKLRAKQN